MKIEENKVYHIFHLVVILFFIFFRFSFAANWPVFMGNNERTGFANQTALPPFTELWSFDVQGDVISGAVVYDGIVYFGARSGYIYALNAQTGELIWDYSSEGFVDAVLAVSSNVLIAPSMDSNLYCFDRLNGNILWSAQLGGPSVSSPLILENTVYVGVGVPENSLKAFDLKTGKLLFKFQVDQPVNSAPSSDGKNIYFGANNGKIYAIEKKTGSFVSGFPYQFSGGSFDSNSIAYSSHTLYALPGHDNRKLFKMSDSGLLLDQSSDLTENEGAGVFGWDWQRTSAPLISTSVVYALAGSVNYYLIGLDKQDLSKVVVSSVNLGNISDSGMIGSAIMANDVIFLNTPDARFLAISSTGAILQTINFSTSAYSTPAVSDGKVFTAVNGGKMIAYKASKYISFASPVENEIINGTYPVKIDLLDPDATGYLIEYSADDENYILLSSGPYDGSEKINYKIFDWDTSSLSNGVYKIKFTLLGDLTPFEKSAIVNFRINQRPLPPSNLTAQDNPNDNGNKIILTWSSSPSPDITEYRIYRSSGYGYNFLDSTISLSYIDSSAITGSTFSYKIAAFDGYLESDFSNESSAFSKNDNPLNDFVAPSSVNNLSGVSGSRGGEVSLTWTAPGDDGDIGQAYYYTIKYSTHPNFDWTNAYIWKSSRAVSGLYGAREQEIVNGLLGGVTYYFALKTYDVALNESPLSNISTACAQVDLDPPAPPSNLTVFDTPGDKGGRLTLTWDLSPDDGSGDNDVYGYKIFRTNRSGVYDYNVFYSSVSAGVRGYIDTQATVNVRYFYQVAAFDSTNLSLSTAELSGISADNWRYMDSRNGGLLSSDDGAEIYIPPGSLNQNDYLLMVRLNPNTLTPLSMRVNTQATPTNITYEVKFENSGTKLLKEAVIKIPYTQPEIAGIEEENLRIYQLVQNTWRIVNTSEVLFSEKKVSARINSLGTYSIMGYKPSGALISSESVYTYPNPAKGDTVTFKFLVSDKSHVTINVYNIAGEKVAKFEKKDCQAGIASEIVWNIKNIASGVYIYRIDAISSGGKKSLTKKMAIAH